jgi:cytochrome c2
MREELRVRRLKGLLLVSSAVCLVFLLLAAFDENFQAEWRAPQAEYAILLAQKAQAAPNAVANYPVELRQIFVKDWNRVDRCVSCHVGIENPDFQSAPQPLTAHPGTLLRHHPVEKYGCTICHQGQGRATDKDGAHGLDPFWEQPLLTGALVQATCARCHHEDQVPEAPVAMRGRRLLTDLGCSACHQLGRENNREKAGPPLTRIGSKTSRKWLVQWLSNPTSYLPHARMPDYGLKAEAVEALAAFLMTFRDPEIDSMPEPVGDNEAGTTVYRESQCIVCHVTKEDAQGEPIGGTIGQDLRKLATKVNPRWLSAFLRDPHAFEPNTKMPHYPFSEKNRADLVQFAMDEWAGGEQADADATESPETADTPERVQRGKRLFNELGCAGCHDLSADDARLAGPELTSIASKSPHEFDFGDATMRRTLPNFLFAKLQSPKAFSRDFQIPGWQTPATAVWQNLRPAALFADSTPLIDGSQTEQLAWILRRTQEARLLPPDLKLPDGLPESQATWLVDKLNAAKAFNTAKMPDFRLSDDDALALTVALMSHANTGIPSSEYLVVGKSKVDFNPPDEFGGLVRRYRCLSCHSIRDAGDRLASDLTYEGSRVNRSWLQNYLTTPYSMRRTLTIAMPIFHFPDEESRFMADYMSQVLVDTRIGNDWERGRDRADAQNGKALFDAKGCLACHQRHGTGGDVGPSLTTQVPEFPHGTWVGDKLKGGWIYQWLLDPQSLLPETLEPNLGLSDQEALDLTAYLLMLKNPDFQEQEK